LVLTFVGIAEVVGGLCLGKLSDCLGRSSVVIFGTITSMPSALAIDLFSRGCDVPIGMVCYSGGLFISVLLKQNHEWTQPYFFGASWSAYVAALAFGFADRYLNIHHIDAFATTWK
jgi:predicted MFS family arabinose efflux permease